MEIMANGAHGFVLGGNGVLTAHNTQTAIGQSVVRLHATPRTGA